MGLLLPDCRSRSLDGEMFVDARPNVSQLGVVHQRNTKRNPMITTESRLFIKRFGDITIADMPLFGGKNASLGEMVRELTVKGVKVPDVGRLFSVIVLLSGSIFMLILLPFMFTPFFYVPRLDAQAAARAPRELSRKTAGHVILTGLSSVERSLIRMLEREKLRYVLLVGELTEALRLYDEGFSVMLGDIDYPATLTHDTQLVIVGDAGAGRRFFEKLHSQSRSS